MAEKETQPNVVSEKIQTEESSEPDQGITEHSSEKSSWPEVVGLTAEESEKKIKEEMAGAYTYVVPVDSFVTMDYRTDRVRIFVDSSGKVAKPPMIG